MMIIPYKFKLPTALAEYPIPPIVNGTPANGTEDHLYSIVMEDIVTGLANMELNHVRLNSHPNENPPKEVHFEIRGTYKP